MRYVLLLVLGLVALPTAATPGDQGETFDLRFDCGQAMCTIVKRDLDLLLTHNKEFFDRMREAEAKLAKDPPVCAKVDVTEPSKNAPPPKPIPPIRRERDS